MLREFKQHVARQNLIREGDVLLVAVSGGVDSMVLVDLLQRSGYSFAIAHMNYGLRGEDSNQDEIFVRKWSDKNKITTHIKRIERSEFPDGISIQMSARTMRYDWFKELNRLHGYSHAVTAHHADDNLETVLFNLAKGTGLRGLTGMEARSNTIIRPLLIFPKVDILSYAAAGQLDWREDLSNQETKYARNKIRNHVIPHLKEINPSLTDTIHDTLERLQGARQMMERQLTRLKKQHLKKEPDYLTLNVSWVESDTECKMLLGELMREFGINYKETCHLHEAILRNVPGKVFHSATHELNLDREQVIITGKRQEAEACIEIRSPNEMVYLGDLQLIVKESEVPDKYDPTEQNAWLDLDVLTFPLQIRSWKEGDTFQPLGMKGSKKISDFLIDQKIPLLLKKDIYVLESNGQISWVIGHRVDDRFKIGSGTKRALHVACIPRTARGSANN
jgi:tRNA(Ile)-lysidine synthase